MRDAAEDALMVRAAGWPDGANPIFFIAIVREYTAVSLADAKNYLDRLRAGETLDLRPYQPDQSAAFVEKLLQFGVVERAEVADTDSIVTPDRPSAS
jgi:hypothetical protein